MNCDFKSVTIVIITILLSSCAAHNPHKDLCIENVQDKLVIKNASPHKMNIKVWYLAGTQRENGLYEGYCQVEGYGSCTKSKYEIKEGICYRIEYVESVELVKSKVYTCSQKIKEVSEVNEVVINEVVVNESNGSGKCKVEVR